MVTMDTSTPVDFDLAPEVVRLLESAETNRALTLAAQCVETYPEYIGGYILLADCYHVLGQTEAARIILDAAGALFPDRLIVTERLQGLSARSHWPVPPEVKVPADNPEEVYGSATDATEGLHRQQPQEIVSEHHSPLRDIKNSDTLKTTQVFPLRVIELVPSGGAGRKIRSTNMRLIPGLEYTSLRFESTSLRDYHAVHSLTQPPPFREFHPPRNTSGRSSAAPREASLEQMAAKLGRLRKSRSGSDETVPAPAITTPPPAVASITLAGIYMQQQNYDAALAMLQLLVPKSQEQQKRITDLIAECKQRLSSS